MCITAPRSPRASPIGTSFTHVCPGFLGGHEWNGAAYSPRLGALFVPATDWCNQIRPAAQQPDPQAEGKRCQYFGGEFQFDPWANARGWLTAFDAATGATRSKQTVACFNVTLVRRNSPIGLERKRA